ncbi:MAG: hypothetical protein M1457_04455 [bacterium]|nr:hypothetical protein [bacterium]
MDLIRADSLAATLEAIDEALFFGRPIPARQRDAAAGWIAGRQGLPGSYAAMFAPTEVDFRAGIRTFTGELVASRAGVAHVLGEDACHVLIRLDSASPDARRALHWAAAGMLRRLRAGDARARLGIYCCARCSVALWRHLAAGGLDQPERRLEDGLAALREARDRKGRWHRFPFYYTLLALYEMNRSKAAAELRYAAPALARMLDRPNPGGAFEARRRVLAARILHG